MSVALFCRVTQSLRPPRTSATATATAAAATTIALTKAVTETPCLKTYF